MKRNKANHWIDRTLDGLIAKELISASETEAYRFGMEMLVLKTVHVISYVFVAAVLGKVREFLIIFGVLCIFRRNTGGFHASTRLGCYIFSCVAIGVSLLLCDAPIKLWQMHVMVLLLLLAMNGCAPVRSRNRRMDDEEAACFKRRLKRESIIFFMIYIACVIFACSYLACLLGIGIFTNTLLMALGKVQSGKTA